MMAEEQHNRYFYWRKNPEWYRRVDNTTRQSSPTKHQKRHAKVTQSTRKLSMMPSPKWEQPHTRE